jgi:quercetin dioxygenase-like cupin family protein
MRTDTIRLGPNQTLRVVGSSPDALELESTWETSQGGKKPPAHWHPRQHERFEVLEGRLTVGVGDEAPRGLAPGDSLDVPPGTAHRMWNDGPATCRATWRISPALRTEEMFRFIERGLNPWRSVRMLWTFRNEFRLGRPRRR